MENEILFCRGGGCTAKLGPGILERVLSRIPREPREELLVGYESSDDAAVYRLSDELAVVQTLDFFPPMVEDPYLFGQIAAANALSDIYAMGGEVKTALNIVCFPEQMDLNLLGKILQGGNEKVKEAGGCLAGGHSIADDSVKYGLSVCGTVHPQRIWRNNTCREGDVLLLTKPLGVGIICTAGRVGEASPAALERAVNSMRTLNRYAAEAVRGLGVHACTDVTGFGFLGHLCEMAGEQWTAVVDQAKIPYFEECPGYVEEFYLTAAAQRNRNHVQDKVTFLDVPFVMEEILFDPQTSGGLLVSIAAEDAPEALKRLAERGQEGRIVGTIEKRREKAVIVR